MLTARRGGRRLVGPEIDAGVRSITKKCASRPAYCCAKVLVLIYLTAKLLILPSAPLRNTSGSSVVVSLQSSRLYRCFLCAPETVRASRAKGSCRRRPCWLLVPSRARLCRVFGRSKSRAMDVIVQLLRAVSRLQNATWPLRSLTGWRVQGQCIDVHMR